MIMGVMRFSVVFASDPKSTSLSAKWEASARGMAMSSVLSGFGVDVPGEFPAAMMPVLTSAGLSYETKTKDLVLAVRTETMQFTYASIDTAELLAQPLRNGADG
ncbi:hypothetical protein ABT160_42890 [Streptomyces sp. NPDC001941]|uniref:hypothetical protein n=1 Tax=Streptomyces sp. NPDC001941 TaxID=3154659 RepID=UPI00331B2688